MVKSSGKASPSPKSGSAAKAGPKPAKSPGAKATQADDDEGAEVDPDAPQDFLGDWKALNPKPASVKDGPKPKPKSR